MSAPRRYSMVPLALFLCLFDRVFARSFLHHLTQTKLNSNNPGDYSNNPVDFGMAGVQPAVEAVTAQFPETGKELHLLRPWPYTKVLIFWCAKFEDRIVDLLMKNVGHLQNSKLKYDILIGHYDQNRQMWLDRNQTWYNENIRWGVDKAGFKVHLLQSIKKEGLLGDDFNISDYDWVWMLDEDVDFSATQFHRMIPHATESQALIVGPAFYQKDPFERDNLMEPFYPMNIPQWDKKFRYVPLVEIIMPLVRPQALVAFFECETCMPPYNSDWGLDHIWCSMLERTFSITENRGCAIVDHTGPIIHKNFGSTRTANASNGVKSEGKQAEEWLQKYHAHDYRRNHFHQWKSWEGFSNTDFQEDGVFAADYEMDNDYDAIEKDVMPSELINTDSEDYDDSILGSENPLEEWRAILENGVRPES